MTTWAQVREKMQDGNAVSFNTGDFVRFISLTPDQFVQSRQVNKWRKNVYVVKCRVKRGKEQFSGLAYITEKQALQLIDLNAFDGENYGPVIEVHKDTNGIDFSLGQS